MLFPVRGIAVGKIPQRVVRGGVIESPYYFVELDSNVCDGIDGIAYVNPSISDVLSNGTGNVVVAESGKSRRHHLPRDVVIFSRRIGVIALVERVAHVMLKQREAVKRPPKSLHALFRWNRVIFNQRDELGDRIFDFLMRSRHGGVQCGLTRTRLLPRARAPYRFLETLI